eukprot:5040145-Pyramimonas_sp.AAC.1
MVEDDSYGLDSDENGRYVELCLTTELSKVLLSEQQRTIFDADRVTTMRVYVTALQSELRPSRKTTSSLKLASRRTPI